jgi:dynein heavy chain
MDLLTGYDKDNIPESRLRKLRKQYINENEMQPEIVQKVSRAGLGLCLWARAMDVYADVAKEVGPKKARLDEMKAQLAITTAQLKEKQNQLKAVMDKVALLQKTCDNTLSEKNRLQEESDTTGFFIYHYFFNCIIYLRFYVVNNFYNFIFNNSKASRES